MKRLFRNDLVFSAIVTASVFLLFLFFLHPIINADDDFYILYTLAGGFGDPPTHLLQYIYGWNPALFWPVAKMFAIFPNINWYTVILLVFHIAGCINILYYFLTSFKRYIAAIIFFLFFLFIESRLLLSLNGSNASIIGAISGCASLLGYYFKACKQVKQVLIKLSSSVLILSAGLLRIHTTGLCILLILLIALPLLSFHAYKQFAMHLLVLSTLLFVSVQVHRYYYEKTIPNWRTEESVRQALFKISNHPDRKNVDSAMTIEATKSSFIKNVFIYNDTIINVQDIDNYYERNSYARPLKEGMAYMHWMFIESRVYLLLLISSFLLFLSQRKFRMLALVLGIFLAITSLLFYLVFYHKMKEGIFLTLYSFNFLFWVFLASKLHFTKNFTMLLSGVLLILSCFWMTIRIKVMNGNNLAKTTTTKCWIKELNQHPSLLFISSDNILMTNGFYIWDTPNKYSVKNWIDKGYVFNRTYKNTLVRFKIENLMNEIPKRNYIVLVGTSFPLLNSYYLLKNNLKTKLNKLDGFDCMNVFQLTTMAENQ